MYFMATKVKHLVCRPVISVQKGTRAIDAVKKMAENNVGSLAILEGDKLVGIITERDILKAVAKEVPLNSPVEEIGTTRNLITIEENDPIYKAAELMSKHNIRHLLVTDKDGKLVGVISIRDLIRESHVLKALSMVSQEEFVGSD